LLLLNGKVCRNLMNALSIRNQKRYLIFANQNVLAESAENVDVTDTVFLDFSIAGRPAGRVKIGLFGKNSPITVKTFLKRGLRCPPL